MGNLPGKFIYFDERRVKSYNKRMEVFVEEIDIAKGLIVDLDVVCGEYLFTQPID